MNGVELEFETELDELWMDIDVQKTQTIIFNLIFNAIKFTPRGGWIRVFLYQVDQSLKVEVEDNGTGVPPGDVHRVFERFYQAEGGRSVGGSGIGLTLSRELARLIGGDLSYKYRENKGALFCLEMPVEELELSSTFIPVEGVGHPEYMVDRSLEGSDDRDLVLVVEDQKDIRSYLKMCLQDKYRVQLAEDGKLGLDYALEHIPDIVISDVMMPRMDGLELCDRLKNDQRTSHIPLILLTAKADLGSRLEGLKQGA